MLTIELTGDQALMARLKAMPHNVKRELARETTALSLQLERHIKQLLSGAVLHVRSGDLRASVHAVLPVQQTETSVTGRVAQSGDVKYGAIHEFGGKTAAHVIEAKGKALAFMMGGKQVFAKRVMHPGSKMPERSYMRRGLADERATIVAGLEAAVKRGMRE